MSRVGKAPITIPQGLSVELRDGSLHAKGPKGENSFLIPAGAEVKIQGDQILVTSSADEATTAKQGLVRALAQNLVTGVLEEFTKSIEVVGVGYKVEQNGQGIKLGLGFSHPVVVDPVPGIEMKIDPENKMIIHISGIDRQKVGQVAAKIRAIRKPEPYKGKGIRYTDEHIIRKAGKSAAK